MTDDLHKYPGNLKRHEVKPAETRTVILTNPPRMTTNDPQAPYGDPEERKPLLSDDFINAHASTLPRCDEDEFEDGARWARDIYEAKITSGELIRRDELELGAEATTSISGQHERLIRIGRLVAYKKITKDEFDQLISRGATFVPAKPCPTT